MQLSQRFIPLLVFCMTLMTLPVSASELVDPTRPATTKKAISPGNIGSTNRGWKLESILVAPDRRIAVINGKLVSEGEIVEGARIMKILNLEVLIQTQGGRMTLRLLPDIVTKQP